MTDKEIPLEGGNSNSGVVKLGDTVRRDVSMVSPTVHRLLAHLHSSGFGRAPRFLGMDDKGREILSYIDGDCGIFSRYWSTSGYLVSAAEMLRDLHTLTADYPHAADQQWGYEYPDTSMHEVICHNDFAPYNLIANESEFVGVVDFDLAGPGPRLRDVAYAVYWLAPVSQRAADMKPYACIDRRNGSARLKLFCRICGVPADNSLLDMISEVLYYMADEQVMVDSIGEQATQRLKAEGHLQHWLGEAVAFDDYRSSIEINL